MTISKEKLQAYLINRSFFTEKAKNVLEVADFYKCIQVDPINVIARTHELSLWNRVENFKLKDLDNELYKNRNLFEYWLQLFSIIPAKYFPYFAPRMHIKGDWQASFYRLHKNEIETVYDFIKEHGVTSPKDIDHLPRTTSLFSWKASSASRTGALHYLWDVGKIMIHHRERNQRFYDLSERVLPAEFNVEANYDDSINFFIESYFHYLGIVRKPYMTKFGYVRKLPVREYFDKLVKKKIITEIKIESGKGSRDRRSSASTYFVLTSELEKINLSKIQHEGLTIIPPLDPLIIDRRIIKDIFDFDYTWEVYVPPSKRKFGYYGMPLLYNGKFIGQVELKKDKNMKVDIVHLDSKVKNKEFKKTLGNKISELEEFITSPANP